VEMGRAAAQRAQEFSWQAHAARVDYLLRKIWHSCGSQLRESANILNDGAAVAATSACMDVHKPA